MRNSTKSKPEDNSLRSVPKRSRPSSVCASARPCFDTTGVPLHVKRSAVRLDPLVPMTSVSFRRHRPLQAISRPASTTSKCLCFLIVHIPTSTTRKPDKVLLAIIFTHTEPEPFSISHLQFSKGQPVRHVDEPAFRSAKGSVGSTKDSSDRRPLHFDPTSHRRDLRNSPSLAIQHLTHSVLKA
jgi:hypothetical protein